MAGSSKSSLYFLILAVFISSYLPQIQSQEHWRHTDDSNGFSNFNESCLTSKGNESSSVASKSCNVVKLLKCSAEDLKCICQDDDGETAFVFDPEKEACIPTPRSELKALILDTCVRASDCWTSHFGDLSRCNIDTEKCECYDTITNGQQHVVMVAGVCHYKRNRGDDCESDKECNATIVGHAICVKQTTQSTVYGKCECATTWIWDNKIQECLKIADTGLRFTCKSDSQCSHIVALGNLSKCDDSTRKCVCFDVETNGKRPTGEFNQKCYVKLGVNETCTSDVECQLGSGQESKCVREQLGIEKHCECHDEHVWGESHLEDDLHQCLLVGKLNAKCSSDLQCQHLNGLGPLSKCAKFENTKMGQCVCWDPVGQQLDTTGFHNGACYHKKGPNEPCNSVEECIVGWSQNAVCEIHESYNREKVCQCPENTICNGANGFGPSWNILFMSFVCMCLTAIKLYV